MPGAPCRNARRADLFFSLDHELDVARQLAGRNHRLQRFDVHERLSLVVVGPAPPDASVAQNRLERIGLPLVERIDRHHVVVTVHEHGRRSRIDDLLAVNDRITVGRHYLGAVGAGGKKRVAQMLGATDHIAPMRAVGADRRDAQQREKLFDETLPMLVDVSFYFFHNRFGFGQAIKITNRWVKHKRFRQKEAAARQFPAQDPAGPPCRSDQTDPGIRTADDLRAAAAILHTCHGRQPQTRTPAVSDTFPERTRLRFLQNLAGHASEIAGKSLA